MTVRRIDEAQFRRTLLGQLCLDFAPGRDFREVRETVPRTQFAFLLGAGCSAESGVLTAGDIVVREWLPRAMYQITGATPATDSEMLDWAESYNFAPLASFSRDDPAAHYGAVFGYLFPQPAEARKETRKLVSAALPSPGYLTLAELMQWEGLDCAITPNFDDLIAHASVITGRGLPRLYGHDAAYADYDPNIREPVVLKIHGDAHLEPRQTEDQTAALPDSVADVARDELSRRGLIVVGYGGRDQSVMAGILTEAANQARHPWYWCILRGSEVSDDVERVIDLANGYIVEIGDFDDCVIGIAKDLGLTQAAVYERVRALPERYQEAVGGQDSVTKDAFRAFIEARALPTDAQTEALEQAHEQFPDSPLFIRALGRDAVLRDGDLGRAEEFLRLAAEMAETPGDSGNLATVLHARGELDEARRLYETAVQHGDFDLDSHSFVLGNLGCLDLETGDREQGITRISEAVGVSLPPEQELRYLMYLLGGDPGGRAEHVARIELLLASNERPYFWWDYEPLLDRVVDDDTIRAALTIIVGAARAGEPMGLVLGSSEWATLRELAKID